MAGHERSSDDSWLLDATGADQDVLHSDKSNVGVRLARALQITRRFPLRTLAGARPRIDIPALRVEL